MYYKANEILKRPFITFYEVASSIAELQLKGFADENGLITDPLVLHFDDLPVYTGGVCHKDIQNGVFIDRNTTIVNDYINKKTADLGVLIYSNLKKGLNATRFTFKTKIIQLDEVTRARITAMLILPEADTILNAIDGTVTVLVADFPDFKTAYAAALKSATSPSLLA